MRSWNELKQGKNDRINEPLSSEEEELLKPLSNSLLSLVRGLVIFIYLENSRIQKRAMSSDHPFSVVLICEGFILCLFYFSQGINSRSVIETKISQANYALFYLPVEEGSENSC